MNRNPYEILGVDPGATADDIKKSFEEKLQALRSKGKEQDTEEMRELIEASGVLLTPQTRQAFDQFLMRKAMPSKDRVRRRRFAWAVAGSVLFIIAIAAAGGWYAWDRGVIPGNPRALDIAVVEPVLKDAIGPEIARSSVVCVAADIERPPSAELRGLPAIQPAVAPGLYVVAMLKELPNAQASRERQLAQLDFFAQQGYLQARDIFLKGPAGTRPARQYTLTWDGYLSLAGQTSGSPCFVAGRMVYEGVKSFTKTEEKMAGFDVYELSYTTKFVQQAKWAGTDTPKSLFGNYEKAITPAERALRLVRSADGWVSTTEMSLLATLTNVQMQEYGRRLKTQTAYAFADLDPADGKSAFEQFLKTEQGTRQTESVCVGLNLSGAGDDTEAPKRGVRNVFTYQDKADRQDYQRRDMIARIGVLEALVLAGGATRESGTGPMPVAGESPLVRPVPSVNLRGAKAAPPPAGPGWVRYRIDPVVIETLNLRNFGGGCVNLGVAKAEFLGVVKGRAEGHMVVARARFERASEMARKLAETIPAIKLALAEGLVMQAMVTPRAEGEGSIKTADEKVPKWEIRNATFLLPMTRFSVLPITVESLLPLTQQLIARDTGAAQVVVEASAGTEVTPATNAALMPPTAVQSTEMGGGKPVAPPPAPAPAPKPNTVPGKSGAADVLPLNANFHVISVREAEFNPGMTPQRRPEGVIGVNVTGATSMPVWLLIDSYEPVHWIVTVSREARLDRVLASGYYPQRVTINGLTGIPVEVSGDGPRYEQTSTAQTTIDWVRNRYRVMPKSVQVVAKAAKLNVNLVAPPAASSSPKGKAAIDKRV